MKLATFIAPDSGPPRVGVAAGSTLVDLQAAHVALAGRPHAALTDMLSLLDAGPAGLDLARELTEFAATQRPANVARPLAEVRLLAPVPRPRSIRDCMAFEQHVIGATAAVVCQRSRLVGRLNDLVARLRGRPIFGPPGVWYRQPIYYKSNPHSVVGPGAEIRWPSFSRRLDYELEFGVFIGRAGRDIAAGDAAGHIAGYTIFNDFSARDVQFEEMAGRLGPAKSKDFDTGNAMGPFLVTPDEVGDAYGLAMTARVNGQTWSSGHSSRMHWSFERIIEHLSRDETLHVGEFIGSGTVGGGCGLELGRWLAPGDRVELEVEKLGVLDNTISPPAGRAGPR